MTSSESWTLLRLLEWTTGYLRKHQAESPRLDAEVLLAACRNCSRLELYTAFEEEASPALLDHFRELVRKRAQGMPVAYLVGHREFFSRNFRVTPDVLIPRPETELMITSLLDLARQSRYRDSDLYLADVGTGSGVLAVTACLELPRAQCVATDLSAAALAIAQENATTHEVANRIEFHTADLLSGPGCNRNFDFILSNPPYVSDSEFRELPRSIRDFEPKTALVAGPHGTTVIERLIPQASAKLAPQGWLIVEISPMIEASVIQRLQADGQFDHIDSVRDLARLPRVIRARRRLTTAT